MKPSVLRRIYNLYPPYVGAGIHVDRISDDWREVDVSMQLRWFNRNVVRTHFGGSLYSMIDPHLMISVFQILGDDYVVWDQSASIRFVRPGRGRVRCEIRLSEDDIADIRRNTAEGSPYRPSYALTILDEDDEVVAEAHKELYVRKKKR